MKEKHYWETPYIKWARDATDEIEYLICYIRTSRQKSRVPAILEALTVLEDLEAKATLSGPLADIKGVFWIILPSNKVQSAIERLPRLGYTTAVDLLVKKAEYTGIEQQLQKTRWRGNDFELLPVYREDVDLSRLRNPDQRLFTLQTGDGVFRAIKGYRGDGSPLGRRALPVCDAKLLVNLAFISSSNKVVRFLDPFAGAGGIVLEALSTRILTLSIDIDPTLRKGLDKLGSYHSVADATSLPFADNSFQLIATEPPYASISKIYLVKAFHEFFRALKPKGRISILCAKWQASMLRSAMSNLGMEMILDSDINRKGTDVVILVAQKENS